MTTARSSVYDFANMKSPLNLVASAGLALGGVFGMAGTLVPQQNLRSTFWTIDALGIIVATALLSLKYFRKGNDVVAAGFLIFSMGESVILSGTAASLEASVPAFTAGIAMWATAVLLISIPKGFPLPVRMLGIASSIVFGYTAALILWGEPLLPISKPLPFFAYPFIVATFIGWIWTLLREV